MGDIAPASHHPFLGRKNNGTAIAHSVESYEAGRYYVYPADGDESHSLGKERSKVALNTKFPKTELLVHFCSLGIIGVLIWINIVQKYWRDFELKKTSTRNTQLKAWQLPAKIHEILMLASLSFVVFYNMRKLLVGRNGIPFGLVSAPYMTGSPSMLLTRSFWAGSSRHRQFGTLLLLVCVLSVVLGPSSAILMIPSLAWYEVKNAFPELSSKIYYTDSKEVLWPTVFNASTRLNATEAEECLRNPFDSYENARSCPASGFMEILEWWVSRMSTDSRKGPLLTDIFSSAQREVEISLAPSGFVSGKMRPTEAYTTVTTELTTTSLGTFYNYARRRNIGGLRDIQYPRLRISASPAIYQPVVHVSCEMNLNGGSDRRDIVFPSAQSAWVDDDEYANNPFVVKADSNLLDGLPSRKPRFSWFKDTTGSTSSSLFALAIVSVLAKNDTVENYQSSAAIACSIDARWAATEASYQPMNSTLVSSNVTDTIMDKLDRSYSPYKRSELALSAKPLDLQLDWAAFLDATQTDVENGKSTNSSAMEEFLEFPLAQLKNQNQANITTFQVPNITTNDLNGAIEEAVSVLLGVVVADSIARTVSLGTSPWFKTGSTANDTEIIPLPVYLRPESTFRSFVDDVNLYSVTLELDRYGYGYALHSKATRAALIALLVFALVVCLHVFYILGAVITSRYYGGDCWESVGDLVALAMNSSPTDKLYGTSAGVEQAGTWKNMVKVGRSGQNHLELFFAGKGHENSGGRVEVNKKYY